MERKKTSLMKATIHQKRKLGYHVRVIWMNENSFGCYMNEYFDACLQQCIIKKYLPHREWLCNLECIKKFQILWLHSLAPKLLHWKISAYPYLMGISIFLLGFFEGDVTTRYAGWWKQSILYHHRDFAKNITRWKSSLRNDAGVSTWIFSFENYFIWKSFPRHRWTTNGGFGGRL